MPTLDQVDKFCSNKCGGRTLYLYDQGLDDRALKGGPLTDMGWCAAMAAFWIQKYASGKNFWEWIGADRVAAPGFSTAATATDTPVSTLRRVMALQQAVKQTYKDYLTDKTKLEYWAPIVEATTNYRRNRSRDISIYKTPGAATNFSGKLGNMISNGPGYRYVVMLVKPTNKPAWSHAVAAYNAANGSVRYMDPNYGEFELPDKPSFSKFVGNFFSAQPYRRAFGVVSYALTKATP
jgi:hypothetical protein